ncbi:MAG: DUF3040 domain-containing protein [Propionibacteriaceae bacterium]
MTLSSAEHHRLRVLDAHTRFDDPRLDCLLSTAWDDVDHSYTCQLNRLALGLAGVVSGLTLLVLGAQAQLYVGLAGLLFLFLGVVSVISSIREVRCDAMAPIDFDALYDELMDQLWQEHQEEQRGR